jgi:hypothetical protein
LGSEKAEGGKMAERIEQKTDDRSLRTEDRRRVSGVGPGAGGEAVRLIEK